VPVLAALAAGAAAQISPSRITVLPAGTELRLVTIEPLSSRTTAQGQRFPLAVLDDVQAGGRVIIPRGTRAVGEVEALSGTGMFGQGGRLLLRPLFVEIGGRRVNLVGTLKQRGDGTMAEAAVTTALLGGLGLVVTGKSAVVPAGSLIFGRIRDDVAVEPAR
jgi:hypothetical protein